MIQLNFSKHIPCTVINYATLALMNADTTQTSDKVGKQCFNYEDKNYYILKDNKIPTWALNDNNPATDTANFKLNMAGQQGIFKANTRLGFWDSANSVAWGDLYDKFDLTPAVRTRAGNGMFSDVIGRIVQILPQGTGFVIYSTKNIVGVRFTNDVATPWATSVVNDMAGVAYSRSVVCGATENEQYAYTTLGLMAIGKYNPLTQKSEAQPILPEFFDLLKESKNPIYLDYINGRYLFICTMDTQYITSTAQFNQSSVPAKSIVVLQNGGNAVNIDIAGITVGGDNGATLPTISPSTVVGTYLIWRGTAQAMNSARTTDISPFLMDAFNIPIPNTPPFDTTSVVLPAAIDVLTQGSRIVDIVPTPIQVESAWQYPGPNKVDYTVYGVIDNTARNLLNLQIAEWNTFNQTLGNTVAALNNTLRVQPTVLVGDFHLTIQLAIDAITTLANADAPLHGGVVTGAGSSIVHMTFTENLGSIRGPITNTQESISGVGTYNASVSLVGNSPNSYDVNRVVDRVYTINDAFKLFYFCTGSGGLVDHVIYPPLPRLQYRAGSYYPNVRYMPDFASVLPAVIAEFPTAVPFAVFDGTQGQLLHPTAAFLEGNAIRVVCIGDGINLFSGISETPYEIHYTITIDSLNAPVFQSVHYDKISLNTKVVAVPKVSTFAMKQTCLDWALSTTPALDTPASIRIPPIGINLPNSLPPNANWTYPGANFLLQDGSIAPIYPIMQGAWVLDTGLKKWGKMAVPFNHLINFSPVNNASSAVPYTNFNMDLAILNPVNDVVLMGNRPVDSWIRYGKIGMARLGFTHMHEVKTQMRYASNYDITVESSLDGRALDPIRASTDKLYNSSGGVTFLDQAGRWHTVKISGQYDLTYLEIRSSITSRR